MVASVCFSFTAMKYDLSKFPYFQKWLLASLERPKAKEAVARIYEAANSAYAPAGVGALQPGTLLSGLESVIAKLNSKL